MAKSKCKYLGRCAFFTKSKLNMPSMLEFYKRKYCLSDYSVCARYKVYSSILKCRVPDDLYPNEVERVEEILRKEKSRIEKIHKRIKIIED